VSWLWQVVRAVLDALLGAERRAAERQAEADRRAAEERLQMGREARTAEQRAREMTDEEAREKAMRWSRPRR